MPVPGDGRYEWDVGSPQSERPAAILQIHQEGFAATANEMNLPPDFPIAERKVGFEWTDRIPLRGLKECSCRQLASLQSRDAMALQTDDYTGKWEAAH